MQLTDFPLVVAVWHQPGCGHCEEFLPRLHPVAQRYAACGVPTLSIDATQNTRLADGLSIDATPTVMVMRRGKTVKRFPRALEDKELEELYSSLAGACAAAAAQDAQELVAAQLVGDAPKSDAAPAAPQAPATQPPATPTATASSPA